MTSRRLLSKKRKYRNENVTIETENSIDLSPSTSKRVKAEPEKRLRRYRQSMTVAVYDRIERALTQRLYLLAMTKSSTENLSREYKVLGQTANVYNVVISHIPSCTCKIRISYFFKQSKFDLISQVQIMLKVIYVNILSLFYIVF